MILDQIKYIISMPRNTWETLIALVPNANVIGELISGNEDDNNGNMIVINNYPNRFK